MAVAMAVKYTSRVENMCTNANKHLLEAGGLNMDGGV